MTSTTGLSVLPVQDIRADFPILSSRMRGHPLVYLDSGATSLKPRSVIDAEVEYLSQISANIHRGVYELSETATTRFDDARAALRDFLNVGESGEIIFTKGATEASNLVAFGWGRKFLEPGDEILTTELEHHANLIPWQQVARLTGAKLRFMPLDESGCIKMHELERVFTGRTRAVAVTGTSNVTGYRPPVAEICRLAHANGAIVVVDGAQLVSHHPTDVQALGCDFLYFSAHKMCGPTGVGALFGRHELLDAMDPLLYGGDMIVRVSRETATFKAAPDKFETGTPNIAGVLAFHAAVSYLSELGMENIAAHEAALLSYAREKLSRTDDVVLYGPEADPDAGGIVSFNLGDIHTHDVGSVLDSEGIAVRTGFHCAQPLMKFYGIPGTVRASFYLYNTPEDIDRLVLALAKAREVFA